MNEDVYEICWNDPEGLAFALAEEDVAQPLASPPAGCHECCLYLTSRVWNQLRLSARVLVRKLFLFYHSHATIGTL